MMVSRLSKTDLTHSFTQMSDDSWNVNMYFPNLGSDFMTSGLKILPRLGRRYKIYKNFLLDIKQARHCICNAQLAYANSLVMQACHECP